MQNSLRQAFGRSFNFILFLRISATIWQGLRTHRMRTANVGGRDAAYRQVGQCPSCRVVVCRAALRQPKTKEALKDPARIGARASVSVEVQVAGQPMHVATHCMVEGCNRSVVPMTRGFP